MMGWSLDGSVGSTGTVNAGEGKDDASNILGPCSCVARASEDRCCHSACVKRASKASTALIIGELPTPIIQAPIMHISDVCSLGVAMMRVG